MRGDGGHSLLPDQGAALAPIVLSSRALPPTDRFARWREELMARVLRVDVDVPDRDNFQTDVRLVRLPGVRVIERRSTPSMVNRDRVLVRDGADDFVFNFAWQGESLWRFPTSEARLTSGQAIVSSLDKVCGFRSSHGGAGVALLVGRGRIAKTLPAVESWLGRRIEVPASAAAILKAYVDALHHGGDLTASTALLAGHQIEELLAHIFDASSDLARAEAHGGLRAARLRAALAVVAENLASPRLNGEAVARRLGVSERYVQRLMEDAGTPLNAHIRLERLKLARRLLQDPRRASRRISEIAEEAGFNDLSYFNRAFRHRFGMTPRDARRQSQTDGLDG